MQRTWRIAGVFGLSVAASLILPVLTGILSEDVAPIVQRFSWVGWTVTLGLGVALAVVEVREHLRRPRPPTPEQADAAIVALATAARQQWASELAIRNARNVRPLAVAWSSTTPASRTVGAHPSAVLNDTSIEGSVSYLRIDGDAADFSRLWQRLPRRQLVIMGEPGSGKTTAVLQCTLNLLSAPAAAPGRPLSPVPVLLTMGSWDPQTRKPLNWMIERIGVEYPFLRDTSEYGADVIAHLLAQDRILPVLDGLDEMPAAWRANAFIALDGMLNGGSYLILTCRRNEYVDTVAAAGRVLAAAAVVELLPAVPETVAAFLAAGSPANDERWQDFTQRVASTPGHVTTALSRPLMAGLARTVYTDRRSSPTELFDTGRFPNRAAVDRHLLGALIPAVYAEPGSRYSPAQAQRWLSFLARHLRRSQTYDFRWWELYRAPSFLKLWLLLFVTVSALTLTVLFVTAAVLPTAFWGSDTGNSAPVGVGAALCCVLVPVLVITLLSVAVTDGIGPVPHPSSGIRSLARQLLTGAGWGFLIAVLAAPAVRFVFAGPASPDIRTLVLLLAGGAAIMATITIPGGLAVGLIRWLRTPEQAGGLTSVASSVKSGQRAGIASAIVIFVICGPIPFMLAALALVLGTEGTASSPSQSPILEATFVLFVGASLGVSGGLFFTPMTIGVSRWFRFRLVALHYALWGQLPWRLLRFLDDAHGRGVLRQVGPVYQFRHADLQDHLAGPA